MKNLFLFMVCSLLIAATFEQGNSGLHSNHGAGNSGVGFRYQASVKDAGGNVLSLKDLELRFSLMPGQHATQAIWVETHSVTTDALGTVDVVIGKGTRESTSVAAQFKDINFAAVHYWFKVEVKESGNYRELSYQAFTSVPYAEVAANAVGCPVGSLTFFVGDASKVPEGWLLCDGREISRSEYAALYAVIGVGAGHGDKSTTFNLPDPRGLFFRVASGDSGVDADADDRLPQKEGGNSGNTVLTVQGDAIRNITGTTGIIGSKDGGTSMSPIGTGALYQWREGSGGWSGGGNESTLIHFDASRVVPVGSDNHPKNLSVHCIIKY